MRLILLLLICLLADPVSAQSRKTPPAPPAKPVPPPAPKVEWRPVYYKNRAYVPASQVADYYDLRVPPIWKSPFALTTVDRKFSIELTKGEKRVKLSGWAFYFSFPVVQPNDVPLISVFDVRNVLDPILRPYERRDPAILRTVIIDPAGGGSETGIKSPLIHEKDLTLAVAKLLGPLLKAKGYQVLLTRETDRDMLPGLRSRKANDITGESIFISLQAGSSTSSSARGFECSTLPPAGTPATNESDSLDIDKRFFAGNINDRESLALAATVQNSVIRAVRTIDLGIRRSRVDALRDVSMPAIACKLGFLSHREEAKKLATRDYQARLASAIVQGVDRYAAFLRNGYEERTEENRQRPLQFGPVTVKQLPLEKPAGAEQVTLRLPIVSGGLLPETTIPLRATGDPGGDGATARIPVLPPGKTPPSIDRSSMELQVFLFETVDGAEIDLSTADPPVVNWLSVLPDWQAGVPEWLQVSYVRPPFTLAETKAYGTREYYGYVARLIYNGRVLDETSFPTNLSRALYYFTPVFPRR